LAPAKIFVLLTLMGLCMALLRDSGGSSYRSEQNPAKVERLDPTANDIIPDGAVLQKLTTGYTWTEGPIWTREGYLLFADIPSNTIRKL
jgi:gluconolactonase